MLRDYFTSHDFYKNENGEDELIVDFNRYTITPNYGRSVIVSVYDKDNNLLSACIKSRKLSAFRYVNELINKYKQLGI
jgi:hypothetical protein